MVGGFQSATGEISAEEYSAHPNVYTVGATWLVKSLALENAGLDPYIFAGELKQPQVAGGKVELAADGWGLLQDRQVERFLIASMALDQWAPGDEDPFNFPGGARILAEPRRQQAGLRGQAEHPLQEERRRVSRKPGAPCRWCSGPRRPTCAGSSSRSPPPAATPGQYDLEFVGTPTGPTGTLTVLQTWNLNTTSPTPRSPSIPAGYDLIGLRVVRTSEAKRAPHVRVSITDIKVGNLATSEPYTLNQAFTALFGIMGTASNTSRRQQHERAPV